MLGQRVGDVRVSRLDQHLNRQRDQGRFGHCGAWELLSVQSFPNAVATPFLTLVWLVTRMLGLGLYGMICLISFSLLCDADTGMHKHRKPVFFGCGDSV
jgi:hypothetical protein